MFEILFPGLGAIVSVALRPDRIRSTPVLSLHREMNRLFDNMFRGFDDSRLFAGRGGWPSMDVEETDKEYAVLDKSFGAPTVTKDGVSVAKEIELKDKFENMGAQMVKEVASNTSDEAGDGTTTATVLAQAIIREGLKSVAAGANPMDLKRGIDL